MQNRHISCGVNGVPAQPQARPQAQPQARPQAQTQARPQEARIPSKAGWVKKATGRFLAGYKDRYVHVEQTEVVVYETEDLKTCLERFDLENFDRCLELKSVFKKKNRLILIRAPKCPNKIHDVKIQVQTPEEKEAWIQAMSEGINRAKNKIFDEIKVDESNNLDHVTRSRPKGNRSRRPPTRIHMKETANVSSEGLQRLDLDVSDGALSNGNLYVNVDLRDPPKAALTPPMPPSSTSHAAEERQPGSPKLGEPQTVVEPNPPKKIIKPPMPPSKDSKAVPATENGPSTQDGPEKVPGPPKPPSKELKPSVVPAEEDSEDLSDDVPDAGDGEKTDPPLTPPTKPMSSSSTENLVEALLPVQETRPPTIPSKDKKPIKDPDLKSLPLTLEGTSDEIVENVSQTDPSSSQTAVKQPEVEDLPESHSDGEHPKMSEATPEPISDSTPSGAATDVPSGDKLQEEAPSAITPTPPSLDSPPLESTRKKPSPLPPVMKKPLKICPPKPLSPVKPAQPEDQPPANTDTTAPQHEDISFSATKPEEALVASVCSTDTEETPGPTTESHHDPPAEKTEEKSEEISEDSICHSDGDSKDSVSKDTLTSSTVVLRRSEGGVSGGGDDGEDHNNPKPTRDAAPPGTGIPQVTSSLQINLVQAQPRKPAPRPPIPRKPIGKSMSASVGDLLSNFSEKTEERLQSGDISQRDSGDEEVKNLKREIALGLEQTKELLSSSSQTQGEGRGKNMPEDLLAKAMEKLRMADHFLREAKNFEESKRRTCRRSRNSW
ncbi:unnamed protein product [Merluccius merluccius]